jgi:hypothetical protein
MANVGELANQKCRFHSQSQANMKDAEKYQKSVGEQMLSGIPVPRSKIHGLAVF